MVGALHEEVNAVVFPIGLHSLQAGIGIRGGKQVKEQQVQRFLTSLGNLRQRMDRVHEWAALSTRGNLHTVDLAQRSEVRLPEFLLRLAEHGVDRALKFAGMAAFCGVKGTLLEDIIENSTYPYPIARTDGERRKLSDQDAVIPRANSWEEALRAHAHARDITNEGTASPPRDLVYGDPFGSKLIFMDRSKALETAAFMTAKTWGDFRKGAPVLYEQAMELLGKEEWHPEDGSEEDEWSAPADSDEIDRTTIPGYEDGDFPYFPEQLMLEFFPELIQQRFGRVEETAFSGPMLFLHPRYEHEIVAALQGQGFSCERDDALMEAVYA